MAGADAVKLQESQDDELRGLKEKGSFGDDALPSDTKPTKARYVYRIKSTADGAVAMYKARLVAGGFAQERLADFQRYSPVAGFFTIRTIPALVALRGWGIMTLDFTQACHFKRIRGCSYRRIAWSRPTKPHTALRNLR